MGIDVLLWAGAAGLGPKSLARQKRECGCRQKDLFAPSEGKKIVLIVSSAVCKSRKRERVYLNAVYETSLQQQYELSSIRYFEML